MVSATTTLGRLIPESGTALTDDDGVAVLYVTEDGAAGAGTLTAVVTLMSESGDPPIFHHHSDTRRKPQAGPYR